jgi:hypothetical protein
MTDISNLRAGDRGRATFTFEIKSDPPRVCLGAGVGISLVTLGEAERIEFDRPAIVPGAVYVDGEGNVFVGQNGDALLHSDDDGLVRYYSDTEPGWRHIPAGIRRARVIPDES